MSYRKKVEVTQTGMVVATVRRHDGCCVGLEFFSGVFNSNYAVEKRAKEAHAWADERIALCERQETGIDARPD